MKISVVTPTFNSASTVAECIRSVADQSYADVEHIIADGASSDNTVELIRSAPGRVTRLLSEKDSGMYSAMNKGISIASGDIIGILNSDDFFTSDDVLQKIALMFRDDAVDAVYGDVRFVKPSDRNKTVRYYSSARFRPSQFRYGFMPAHPSFYVRSRFYRELGGYKEDYRISADFELLVRFLYRYKLSSRYLAYPVVTMLTGGISTRSFKSNLIINQEIIRGCRENGISTNYLNVYSKYFVKAFQLISKGDGY
ncbi:MAG: glycosyltransferase [Bacteroidales bacterium]|nr:glycosyltransferase [Bacteroidales bacterium]